MAKIGARGHHRSGLKEGPKCDFAVGSRGKLHWADSTRTRETHTAETRTRVHEAPPCNDPPVLGQGAAFRFFIVSFVLAITPTRNSPLLTTYLALVRDGFLCLRRTHHAWPVSVFRPSDYPRFDTPPYAHLKRDILLQQG